MERGEGCPFVTLPGLGSSNLHKEFHKEPLAPRGGGKWGGGKQGDPRAGNAPSLGLGSKMGAVLTTSEAAKELRGQGAGGGGSNHRGGRESRGQELRASQEDRQKG